MRQSGNNDNIIYFNTRKKEIRSRKNRQSNSLKPYGCIALMLIAIALVAIITDKYCDIPITVSIIAANVAVFVMLKTGRLSVTQLGSSYNTIMCNGQYYRIVSSAFSHEDPLHIICNMYSLYNLGTAMENFLGPFYFSVSYIFLTLAGGYTASRLKKKHSPYRLSIGASGVLCGFLGMYTVFILVIVGVQGIRSLFTTYLILGLMTFSKNIDSIGHFVGLFVGIIWGLMLVVSRLYLGM